MSTPIRLATPGDGAALAAIYAPAVAKQATSFELECPSAAEMGRRVGTIVQRTPWLVCEYRDAILGYAYAGPHRDRPAYQWSVDVSAYVSPEVHRRGVARALYLSLLAVLKLQGFRNAYAGIALPNPASVGLHAAMGFKRVGVYHGVGYKLGAWHDVAWFELALAERVTEPPPPRPLPELLPQPMFAAALAAGIASLRLAAQPPAATGSP
jgi:L-amino acid N-acyltransferase YncA